MKNFADQLRSFDVPKGSVGVFFLGQAGFVFKTSDGQLVAVDPYLSNCCERYFGFKRLMPCILEPEELIFDTLVISHAHYDHFDPDSVPQMMSNGHTELIGAKDVAVECDRFGLKERVTYLSCHETARSGQVRVTGLPCDHGELAPHALGLLLEMEGKRIYIMGDTAYRPDFWDIDAIRNADLLILPINGAFGNLNEQEAADTVAKLTPRLAIPCHYWNFAEHGGNPGTFQEAMKREAPEQAYVLMRQGEGMLLS